MPSFDVISKINYQEFDNALANCLRKIGNQYDFKGLNISIIKAIDIGLPIEFVNFRD